MSGSLILVATPIGNLGDMSERGLDVLRRADAIACEDTRRTRKLLTHFGISGKTLIASHEHNETTVAQRIVERVAGGETVALVSDSGTPGVSDPGQKVVRAVVTAGLDVSAVPGASAALAALVVSGFDTERFVFEGFLPRTGADRQARISSLVLENRTTIVYESPNRVAKTCGDLAKVLGPGRRAVLVREFTKIHEEVRRGTLVELHESLVAQELRGECVLVLDGAAIVEAVVTDDDLAIAAAEYVERGMSTKDAAAQIADGFGVSKKRAYDALLKIPRKPSSTD